jgi:hypothetical protein
MKKSLIWRFCVMEHVLLQQNFNRVLIFNLAALNLRQISGPGRALIFKKLFVRQPILFMQVCVYIP